MRKKKGSENLRVVVRCRDLMRSELENGYKSCVQLNLATNQVLLQHPVGDPDIFSFDAVFNNVFSQRDIFLQEVQPLVDAVLNGYNATVIAYGQDGAGKTYTMTGDLTKKEGHGMMPQVVDYLFTEIKRQTSASKQFKVKLSYVDISRSKPIDLLADKRITLDIKQNLTGGFFVKGATAAEVPDYETVLRLFNEGTLRRQTAETADYHTVAEPRPHSFFTILVEHYDYEPDESNPLVTTSKFNLVDLTGSQRRMVSLSSLATVIDTIVKGGKHIPYRSSSLAMLLKDSLGGNSKTVMFANVGPSDHNLVETVSTLRFADRAKQVTNRPTKNFDPKDARIQELTDQVEELRRRLVGDVDLDQEGRLQCKIGELEVENVDLRGAAEKDMLRLEEELKVKTKEVENLQNLLEDAHHQRQILEESTTSLDGNQQMAKLLEAEKKKVTELEEEAKRRERSFDEMEENWRAQLIENTNKLVQINNKRLEEQAAQYQDLISDEQDKQKTYKSKLKKARELIHRAEQKYEAMVLENEALISQFEEAKISAVKAAVQAARTE